MIFAVDPGNHYLGISAFDGDTLLYLFRIRGLPTPERTYRERVHPMVVDFLGTPGRHRLGLEEPPPTARKSRGPRIGQAAIGYPLGYQSGLIAHDFVIGGHSVERVPVRDWRATMYEVAGERRWSLDPPEPPERSTLVPVREEDGRGTFTARWEGCEHTRRGLTLAQLQSSPPLHCPTCHGPPSSDVSETWKRRACLFAARMWPHHYERIVAEALATARTDHLPDHQLEGVPDACESAAVGLHLARRLVRRRTRER